MGAKTGNELPSAGVPAKERFDYWQELIGRSRASEVISAHTDDFAAEMRRLELGPVTLLRSSFPPALFRRAAGVVRRSDPEVYHLTLLRPCHDRTMPFKVAVLASHAGSNLRALTSASQQPRSAFAIAVVISNNSGSGALAHARDQGIAHAHAAQAC